MSDGPGRRVAVVTGAGRGIGAAVVRRLAGEGWGVVALDRCDDDEAVPYPLASPEDLEALAGELPGSVVPLKGDVRRFEDCARAVGTARERFGGLDAAVACAAVILGGGPLWERPREELDRLLAVNVGGVANLAAASVPELLRRPRPRSGRFIALASAAAHTGLPGLAGYTASKHAVLGLVRALADDLGDSGVSALAVSPGSTRTAMLDATASLYGLSGAAEFAVHQSLGRLLEPEEIAGVVAFLAGTQSSGMTGVAVQVDGGFHG